MRRSSTDHRPRRNATLARCPPPPISPSATTYAHPTEVVRRTLLQKYTRIGELLARRDGDLTIP
ncbi:MAG TPA: phosphoenolpyruvate carboxylase [Thermoanaerobaculia bacterium]|jgi:hypothetical protein